MIKKVIFGSVALGLVYLILGLTLDIEKNEDGVQLSLGFTEHTERRIGTYKIDSVYGEDFDYFANHSRDAGEPSEYSCEGKYYMHIDDEFAKKHQDAYWVLYWDNGEIESLYKVSKENMQIHYGFSRCSVRIYYEDIRSKGFLKVLYSTERQAILMLPSLNFEVN
ncbi:MAG: hypothetical protein V3U02_06870 [Calditrichia bacterium]